jgi:methionyl-tRNA synthetase
VNRVWRLVETRHGSRVPQACEPGEAELRLAAELDRHLAALRRHQDGCALRKSTTEVAAVWRLANAYLAAEAPWALARTAPERAASVLNVAVNLVALSARLAWPCIPGTATRVLAALGEAAEVPSWPRSAAAALHTVGAGTLLGDLPVLFAKLTDDWVACQERRFDGTAAKAVEA